jgi:hypothetical protein
MHRLRGATAPILLMAGVVIAGCGGSGAPTPTAPGTTTTPTSVVTAPPATTLPTEGGLPSFALPSFVGDKDLEAMLPKEIGGQPLTVLSMTGNEFLGTGQNAEMNAMLTQLGKTPSDLSVAFAGTANVTIVAFRVKGVPAGQILPALVSAYQEGVDATPSQTTIAGKSVTKFTPAAAGETATYIYTAGDTVFAVGGMSQLSDAVLNEVFSKLP